MGCVDVINNIARRSRRSTLLALFAVVILYLRRCWHTVSTSELAIVERFGKFAYIAPPGLHFVWLPFYRIAGRLSTRVQQLNVKTDTKTKDNVTVDLTIAVQYRVIDREIPATADNDETAPSSMPVTQNSSIGFENHGVWRAFYRLTGIKYQLQAYVEVCIATRSRFCQRSSQFYKPDSVVKSAILSMS